MQHKNLLDVLTRGGLAREGEAFVVPSGLTVTVYLSLGQETLVVDRVVRVEISGEVATVVTHRKERYAVENEAIEAVRFHPEANAAGYA